MKAQTIRKELRTAANLVTISRILLLLPLALAAQVESTFFRAVLVAMVPIIFYLDSLDGYLARTYNCSTKLGSVLDVAGDRIVENVLWLLLAYARVIPVWIPVIILARAFITDAFRSVAVAKGYSIYEMMTNKMEYWLVASPASRSSYAVFKAIVFTLGMAIWTFQLQAHSNLIFVFQIFLSITVAHCLLRGYATIKACVKRI